MSENTPTPKRVTILADAAELIVGTRQEEYGTPQENFDRIARLWSIQIEKKLKEPLTPTDIALMMTQLKMARMVTTPNEDSFKDAAGYVGIGYELSLEEGDGSIG